MDEEVKVKLFKAKSVGEMLRILSDYYDLDSVSPGVVVKGLIVSGLQSAINMTKPKKRR